MPVTLQDVMKSSEAILGYNWPDELGDFETQFVENDGVVRGHVFWDLFVMHNVTREVLGQDPELLSDIVFQQEGDERVTVYRCESCGTLCLRPDPMGSLTLDDFEPGDRIPAGACPCCCHVAVYPV